MENYFLYYDSETGEIIGFYKKSIHGDKIPSPAIEITEEQHEFYMIHNGLYKLSIPDLQNILIPVSNETAEQTPVEKNTEDISLLQQAFNDFISM